jgi:acetoin utilization deacetylase AcuC-like enzyme
MVPAIDHDAPRGGGSRGTGYAWHERFAWHDTGTSAGLVPAGPSVQPFSHFESPESKARLASLVEVSGLASLLERLPVEAVVDDDVLRVHSRAHLDRLRSASASPHGGDAGDGHSPFGPGSLEIALLAAGGTAGAVDAVLDGRVRNAYALVRPPGHHAEREGAMGFCMLANIAIAVERARVTRPVLRVAVVDFDVHHGNGTQSLYYDDPNTLTISIHQEHLFPLTSGTLAERGSGAGRGYCINVPLYAGSGNGTYVAAFEQVVVPAVSAFAPDLIVVACGFDASALDPLGAMTVTSVGFAAMGQLLVELADHVCAGRLVMSHEGGYSPVYVPYCGLAVLEAMSGISTGVIDPFSHLIPYSTQVVPRPFQLEPIVEAVALVRELESILTARS